MTQHILSILVVLFLLGCNAQKKEIVGTDTGNPVIQATISDSTGIALPNAKVIIYSQEESPTALLRTSFIARSTITSDTLLTDSDGKVAFNSDGATTLGVEVYWNNSLGLYTSISVAGCSGDLLLTAQPLVDFPTNSDLVLSNTGRRLSAGSVTKIPPGLWEIRYIRFGSQDTLPPLQVRIEDASSLPQALQSLNIAAAELAKIGVEPLGYVEFADYPTEPSIISKIEYSCSTDGYSDVSLCKNDNSCRIWQWESNWVAGADRISVLAGALTYNGEILCMLFPDQAISGRPIFYSFSEVRQNP